MRIINPKAELICEKNPYRKVEMAARTCYKSTGNGTEEGARKMCQRLIKSQHTAMLEHAVLCFELLPADPSMPNHLEARDRYMSALAKSPYMHVTVNPIIDLEANTCKTRILASGNLRAISERGVDDPVFRATQEMYPDLVWGRVTTDDYHIYPEVVAKIVNIDELEDLTPFEIGEHKVDFKPPYRRLPILDAIKEYAGVDVSGMDEDELRATCKKLNVEVEPSMGKGKLIDAIFGEYAEKNLIEPTYIIDYPVEMSPLTKRHRSNPALTERFELFVCGKELANAYSELNDPIDQLERFEEQARLKSKGDDEAMFIDYDFVRALEYGMPPTSGLGMGIDRLTMFMTGQSTIQDVLFFPQMKPEKAVKKEEEKEQ